MCDEAFIYINMFCLSVQGTSIRHSINQYLLPTQHQNVPDAYIYIDIYVYVNLTELHVNISLLRKPRQTKNRKKFVLCEIAFLGSVYLSRMTE